MADKGSVTGKIAHYIRKNIRNGNWTVGEKIPSENQLCEELGVSRVSVRSALQQFIALGILESVHGKGTFLISDDLSAFYSNVEEPAPTIDATETMKQILEFRSIVEPAICAQVAQTASPELIAKLEGYLKTMKASVGKCEEFINADVAFHMEIINACGQCLHHCHYERDLPAPGQSGQDADSFHGLLWRHLLPRHSAGCFPQARCQARPGHDGRAPAARPVRSGIR